MKLTLAFLLIAVLVVFSACAQPAETPLPTTPPPATTQPTETPPPTTPPPATITHESEEATPTNTTAQEDVEAARQVVFAYWEAYNSYDEEGVLAHLEESYRQDREANIRSEIGQMKMFGITIGVEEEAEPVITPDEMIGITLKLNTPRGEKHYTYYLKEIDGEWKICLAEEQKS